MADLPIVCTLTPDAIRQRQQGLLSNLLRSAEACEPLPDGVYTCETCLDNDRSGGDTPVPLKIKVIVEGDELTVDYTDSGAQSHHATLSLTGTYTASDFRFESDQNGGTTYPSPNSGWASEIALDIEMVSAVCPSCKILLVEATSPTTGNLGTAVNTAVAQGAIAVSNTVNPVVMPPAYDRRGVPPRPE